MTTAKDPFALAIASFISDIKSKEDIRSPFYKEVLSQIKVGSSDATQVGDTIQCEHQLDAFIQELERKQKRNSKTLWVTNKLRPLVAGLAQYTSACDVMISAAPSAAVLLYGGARVVLQLAQNFTAALTPSCQLWKMLALFYNAMVFSRKRTRLLLTCKIS